MMKTNIHVIQPVVNNDFFSIFQWLLSNRGIQRDSGQGSALDGIYSPLGSEGREQIQMSDITLCLASYLVKVFTC